MGKRWAGMIVAGALVASVASCGGGRAAHSYVLNYTDQNTAEVVDVRQGPMPAENVWTGVYQSPQIGQIELVQTGDAIIGNYEYDRASCHVVARIEGSVSGNLLRFQWTENHRPCGRIAPVVGRAYFLYWTDDEGRRGRLDGEWGYDNEDHGGGHWRGYKIRGRRPRSLENTPESGGASGDGSGDGSSGGGSSGGGSSGGSSSGGGGM